MPLLSRVYTSRRDKEAAFLQLVAHPQLTISRLFNGEGCNSFFNSRINTVLQDGFLATDLLQVGFSMLFVQFLEVELFHLIRDYFSAA